MTVTYKALEEYPLPHQRDGSIVRFPSAKELSQLELFFQNRLDRKRIVDAETLKMADIKLFATNTDTAITFLLSAIDNLGLLRRTALNRDSVYIQDNLTFDLVQIKSDAGVHVACVGTGESFPNHRGGNLTSAPASAMESTGLGRRSPVHREDYEEKKHNDTAKRLSLSREADERAQKLECLENLAPEAIRNIIRSMSNRPGAEDWMNYLRFKDVEKLYIGNGYVSEQCRRLVCRLSFGFAWRRNYASVRSSSVFYQNLARLDGQCIKSLVICCPPSLLCNPALLLARCAVLEDLDISGISSDECGFHDLFKVLPSSVTSLSVNNELSASQFTAIRERCKKLRMLDVCGYSTELKQSLKDLSP